MDPGDNMVLMSSGKVTNYRESQVVLRPLYIVGGIVAESRYHQLPGNIINWFVETESIE